MLDVYKNPGCPWYSPIWRRCYKDPIYATKISILDVANIADAMIIFFKNLSSYTPYKALASATSTMVFVSKKPTYKVNWSQSSILVVAVALDPRSLKFAWAEGPQKTSLNPSKSPSNVLNLLCWLMYTYSFVKTIFSNMFFSPSIQSASKGTSIDTFG